MQHTSFGKTGLQVSKLCLGTMTFGLQCDEAQSHAILDTAASGGGDGRAPPPGVGGVMEQISSRHSQGKQQDELSRRNQERLLLP